MSTPPLFCSGARVLTVELFSKCGASSGSSSRSSSSSWASWSASSRSRYVATGRTCAVPHCILRAHRDVFCVRNRRLSKRRTRSTSCPCRGRRMARALCRCCRRLSRCSSAPCRPHCSLGYERRSARVRYVGLCSDTSDLCNLCWTFFFLLLSFSFFKFVLVHRCH